ncbi:hypothetical protein ACTNBL_01655 [Enterococcus villorum]|uniref:hypothetical protein n=1 Tax=Enterococcus villorum TaxID=112904 RepID=UPI003F8A15CD
MKKSILFLLPLVFLIAGCEQKSTSQSTSESTVTKTTTSHETTTDSKENSKSTDSTKKNSETTSQNSNSSTFSSTALSSTMLSTISNENSTSVSVSSSPQMSESTDNSTNLLSNYSDLQIEYARVWLAVMGTHYKQWLADPSTGFELHVSKSPAGTPVDTYDPGSVVFPTETVTLSGGVGFQGLVVYSSNHNGTITQYQVPSHWQHDETSDHPELVKEKTQKILDEASTISIPTNNPEDIKQLIDVMVIDN